MGKEVVGIEKLGTAMEVFEMFDGGEMELRQFFDSAVGIECSLCLNSSG